MDEWVVGAVANGVIAVGYLTIAWLILARLGPFSELRRNPLALATGLIFVAGGTGRALRLEQLLATPLTPDHVTAAARAGYDWSLSAWDTFTGVVAVWYVVLRRRHPHLASGGTLYDDVRVRKGQALELHDNVVQGLTSAKLAFEMGHQEEGLDILGQTLVASRNLVTELLGEDDDDLPFEAGELRRATPGGVR